jgi:hypothetical protein
MTLSTKPEALFLALLSFCALLFASLQGKAEDKSFCQEEDIARVRAFEAKVDQKDLSLLGVDNIFMLPSRQAKVLEQRFQNDSDFYKANMKTEEQQLTHKDLLVSQLSAIPNYELGLAPEKYNSILEGVKRAQSYDELYLAMDNLATQVSGAYQYGEPHGQYQTKHLVLSLDKQGKTEPLELMFDFSPGVGWPEYYSQALAKHKQQTQDLHAQSCDYWHSQKIEDFEQVKLSAAPYRKNCHFSLEPVTNPTFGMTQQSFWVCSEDQIEIEKAPQKEIDQAFAGLKSSSEDLISDLQK